MLCVVGAAQGKSVVRLKGGCPSTFSRVGSEAAALAAAGLAYEMVPGVSSATAAPVLAGAHNLSSERMMLIKQPKVDMRCARL
jgi:siroheme synthase